MSKLDFKHLDLISKNNINEERLPKAIKIKIAQFKISYGQFQEDPDNENAEAKSSRLSDEIADEITKYMQTDEFKAINKPAQNTQKGVSKEEVAKMMDERDEQKRQAKLKAKHDAEIEAGNKALADANYDAAISHYNNAMQFVADSAIAKEAITKATSAKTESTQKAEAEATEKYNALITQADAAFSAGTFADAKTAYLQALEVKPNEAHPTAQVAECDKNISTAEETARAAKAAEEAEAERKAKSNPVFDTLGF